MSRDLTFTPALTASMLNAALRSDAQLKTECSTGFELRKISNYVSDPHLNH